MLYLHKKRKLMELKKKFAYEIVASGSDLESLPEQEQLEILGILELSKNITNDINNFFDTVSTSNMPQPETILSVVTLLTRVTNLLKSFIKIKESGENGSGPRRETVDQVIDDILRDL